MSLKLIIVCPNVFNSIMIAAHQLFWGHCVKSGVIILNQGIIPRGKIPRSKTITDEFKQIWHFLFAFHDLHYNINLRSSN